MNQPPADSSSLFQWHFPLASRLISRAGWVGVACGLAALAASATGAYVVALGFVSIAVGVAALWLDRGWLATWPIPPAFWFATVCIATGGVGPMVLELAGEAVPQELLPMQVAIIVGHASFLAAYGFARPSPENSGVSVGALLAEGNRGAAMVGLGVLCLAWSVADAVVGAYSGAYDRGIAGEQAAYDVFGYWTYFAAFNRLNSIGFLLLPFIYTRGNWLARGLGALAAVVLVFMGALTGSRYNAFTPFVMLAIGYVVFVRRPRVRAELMVLAALPVAVVAFIYLDHFRNTDTFRQESLADPLRKAQAVVEASNRAKDMEDMDALLVGDRLVGVIDPLIYGATPAVLPHAGFSGFDAVAWLYVPTFFYPNHPTMIDGNAIAEEYLGQALVRTSIGPSLTGDLYRRFGRGGVVLGMAVVGLAFGLLVRVLFHGLRRDRAVALLYFVMLCTIVVKDANMTVLTGLWVLLYDIPKYSVVLLGFLLVGRMTQAIWCAESVAANPGAPGRERFRRHG